MKNETSKFINVWKVCFKYLFYVSIFAVFLKVVLFGLHNGFGELKITNVLFSFGIYIAGAVLLGFIISLWAVFKDREYP